MVGTAVGVLGHADLRRLVLLQNIMMSCLASSGVGGLALVTTIIRIPSTFTDRLQTRDNFIP